MRQYVQHLIEGRHVLRAMGRHDFKNKYRNSILGVAWAFLSPLGTVAIIGVVYSILFRMTAKEFIPYLFLGIIPWNFLTESAAIGSRAFISSHGYIKQTRVPLEVFPARVVISTSINFLLSLAVFILLHFLWIPENIGPSLLFAPLSLAVWIIFVLGYTTLTALITTYLRDYEPIQTLIFQGLFYATPVLYRPEMIPEQYSLIYKINPLYYMLELIRRPLLGEGLPSWQTLAAALCIAFATLALSAFLLRKAGRNIAFKL